MFAVLTALIEGLAFVHGAAESAVFLVKTANTSVTDQEAICERSFPYFCRDATTCDEVRQCDNIVLRNILLSTLLPAAILVIIIVVVTCWCCHRDSRRIRIRAAAAETEKPLSVLGLSEEAEIPRSAQLDCAVEPPTPTVCRNEYYLNEYS